MLFKKSLFFVITCLLSINCFAQSNSEPILIKKSMGTYFELKGEKLTQRALSNILKSNPEAFKYMEKANSNMVPGTIFSFAGGFLVGWPIGTAIGGKEDPNWALAGIGAGLIAVSIPFAIGYNKNAKKAVNIYNEGLKQTSLNSTHLNFCFTGNGLGLKLTF